MGDQKLQKNLNKMNRVTFKRKNENYNIMVVLKELYSQVLGKDLKTSQRLELALASLSKYPLEITSGEGCFILQGFDKNLCRYIDERLFNNKKEFILEGSTSSLPLTESNDMITGDNASEKMDIDICTTNRNNISIKHVITNLTYHEFDRIIDAIIVWLYHQELEFPNNPALSRTHLKIKVQQHFKKLISNWCFLKELDKYDSYLKITVFDGYELYYSLSDSGRTVALSMMKTCAEMLVTEDDRDMGNRMPPFHTQQLTFNNRLNNELSIIIHMSAGSYEIVLLVDKNEPDILINHGKSIKSESRSLKVGDIMWVARSKSTNEELVLPFILERKRIDDYSASIKDGRFHEQKFRLRKCSLRNVIYLIENFSKKKYAGLSMATLNQAQANTRVQDGFLIHHTASVRDTKRFLNMMTMRLTRSLKDMSLQGHNSSPHGRNLMTFEYFNASSSKTKPLTIKEIFIKMLLQLKGVSVEKALAITKVYNSPMALMRAYDECVENSKDAEMLLTNLKFNSVTPRVTPSISKVVNMMFDKLTF